MAAAESVVAHSGACTRGRRWQSKEKALTSGPQWSERERARGHSVSEGGEEKGERETWCGLGLVGPRKAKEERGERGILRGPRLGVGRRERKKAGGTLGCGGEREQAKNQRK